ncbi:peptidylprolyl isomerase [bacterium]|nr:peptidylprolyl isomerase [bacterium]
MVCAISFLTAGELILNNGKKIKGYIIKKGAIYTLKTSDDKLYQFGKNQIKEANGIDSDISPKVSAIEEALPVKISEPLPEVLLTTTEGKVKLVLFEDEAPNTVSNFIQLIENKFYNNILFHRIVPGFVAQAGDPNTKGERGKDFILHEDIMKFQRQGKIVPKLPIGGTGDPGYKIKAEFNSNKHLRGSLAMARSTDIDSAGSQFYICFKPQPKLDGKYTVFGKVLTGMDVIDKLTNSSRITDIKILKRREHEYIPDKIK